MMADPRLQNLSCSPLAAMRVQAASRQAPTGRPP